jgi:hypothetical protein
MTRGFLRFVRGNAIAMLALFIALTGTTYAASTALIGKNTVASPQVVNGSLQTKDLSKKARAALKGNRGLRGLQGLKGDTGAAGAPGAPGAPGPSAAYSTSAAGNTQVGASSAAPVTILSLSLPAGKYVVTATTGLTNISGATRSAWCTLQNGTTQLGMTRGFDVADATQRSTAVTVQGAVTLAATATITFQCYGDAANVWIPAQSRPSMQAIMVGSLTVS